MDDTRKEQQLPVAEVNPGDFPLCSMESRAAARALAERKNETKRVFRIQFMPARDGCPDVEKMMRYRPCLIRREERDYAIFEFWEYPDAET